MPKFPTPSRCRRNLHHAGIRLRPLFDVLDNSCFLKWAIEIHQKPFPPPGVPYLDDQQGWEDYLNFDVRTQEELETQEPTPNPKQEGRPDSPHNGIVVVAAAAAAAEDDLLDSERGSLVICNPDRLSLLHGDPDASHSPTEAFLFPPHGSLTVCNPDSGEALPEEQDDVSETPQEYVLSQAPGSPASPLYQSFGLEDGCECAPSGDSSDVYQEEHIFFGTPETAQAVPLLPLHQPRLVTVPSPPAPPYRTLLSQNPRRRGVIFLFL
ncbi:hypothetical protein CTA2_3389 [Colletotrichum tanaceti]|uniref:Uncharacterized protein n=1 Tax=Colletotrichum tanaceti TaxID=1306861 RepID=A0A4U6XSN4_9PEZI|nr:hypothetical protein CTA2_3389 [Colletotrichum tanaceti]TKW58882.1 hypothetical protein CTA1_8665 [Colletotrichum tanaceti]